jgi:hypothetical protein
MFQSAVTRSASATPKSEWSPVVPTNGHAAVLPVDRPLRVLRALDTAQAAAASPGLGEPLSQSDREAVSARFGYDFSRVRVHADSSAARAVGARGFVSGQHIWFSPGRGPADRALLMHEAAHVVQQATGEANLLHGAGDDLVHRDRLERHARNWNVRRPPSIGRIAPPLPGPPQPGVIQFDFEEDALHELHRMPAAEEEGISAAEQKRRVRALAARGGRLFELFSALSGAEADDIYERLRVRRKGDILSERFHDMLSSPLREDLLASIGSKHRRRVPLLRALFHIPGLLPDPGEFCKPFSKREIDQGVDFDTANLMDRLVNTDMREQWGDEAADLYDTYLTSTAKNTTPKIFDDPGSKLVQSFVNDKATDTRQRALAAIIESNLPSNCGHLPPNEWVDFRLAAIISPAELNAPFSFSDVFTIAGLVAGGVSPGPGAPESRKLSIKQVLIRRADVMGFTTGVQLRVQFHFVVQDSIDFCPGAMGGPLAQSVTIPMSRLEASGMAFPVPFEVHYEGPALEVQLGPAAVNACS